MSIEELHRIREEIAAQCDYDVFAIGAMLQAKPQKEGRSVVSFNAHPNELEFPPMDKPVKQAA